MPLHDGALEFPHPVNGSCVERLGSGEASIRLSAWSASPLKRIFDVGLVLAFCPLLIPALFVLALIVRLSSRGPVLFRQTRVGAYGRLFTILKFRTMTDSGPHAESQIVSPGSGRITPAGRLMRKWKLDELPQCVNVLRGDMSLIGPRPRIVSQQMGWFPCRPGLTGAATLAFAREEFLFASVPHHLLADFYRESILPAKHRLDSEYMERATVLSDIRLLALSVLRIWPLQHSAIELTEIARCNEKAGPSSVEQGSTPRWNEISASALCVFPGQSGTRIAADTRSE